MTDWAHPEEAMRARILGITIRCKNCRYNTHLRCPGAPDEVRGRLSSPLVIKTKPDPDRTDGEGRSLHCRYFELPTP